MATTVKTSRTYTDPNTGETWQLGNKTAEEWATYDKSKAEKAADTATKIAEGNERRASKVNIPVSTLQLPDTKVKLPEVKTSDYSGYVAGGNAMIENLNKAQEKSAGSDDDFISKFVSKMETNKPQDMSSLYSGIESQYGIDEKTNASIQSKKDLDVLNAQLADITAQTQAQQLNLEEASHSAGGMNSPSFLSRQQSEISRKAAITALPLQAQILAKQAELTANNSLLEAAQKKVDTLFQIQSEYAKETYTYNQDLIKSVFEYADEQQKAALEEKKTQNEQAFTLLRDNISNAQNLAKTAIASGQGALAGQIMALDTASPTYQQDLSNLAGQIVDQGAALDLQIKKANLQGQYLQNQKYQQDLDGIGTSEILSPTEAATLGVPYGTTEAQAAQMGITPQGKTTQAQQTVAGYATRIEQAEKIMSNLESTISGMNWLSFTAQQKAPSFAKTGTMQQYDQASKNFINAVLRRESGAVISDAEFANARSQYLPQPGDTEETLKQKADNRLIVLENYKNAAGGAYESVEDVLSGSTTENNMTDNDAYQEYLKIINGQ